jgi:hypothetical protein
MSDAGAPFTYVVVSINGGEYPQKQPFQTLAGVRKAVPGILRDQTSYWRVWVLDQGGRRVLMGTRSGYNATGNSWVWADAQRAEEAYHAGDPGHYQEADSGVVTSPELEAIVTRHVQGTYRRHEINLGRYEI